ncbi:MAG: ABC transporter permease [Candidatus Falkowbacteria bacterium]
MNEKITIIKPRDTFHWSDLAKLWDYHELLYYLTWRDLKVRYKQTVIGVAWVIFQPFVSMIVFSVFFGNMIGVKTDPDASGMPVPYPIFVFVGLLFWQFFSSALADISNCLVANQNIISKVYFPRILLPISMILTRFIDFLVASVILLGLMLYYGYLPHLLGLLMMPLLFLMTFLSCLGMGLFFAALNVKYRDVKFALPFFIQMMMFVTPVIYSTSIAGKYAWVFAINPMATVIKSARSAFLGVWDVNWLQIGLSLVMCLIMLAVGWWHFRKEERESVDLM